MSRKKLKSYDYYNYYLPAGEKSRLQTIAEKQERTLAALLGSHNQAADLLRDAAQQAQAKGLLRGRVEVWVDGDQTIVAVNGHVVKI